MKNRLIVSLIALTSCLFVLSSCGKVSATSMKVIKVEGVATLENNGKQAEPKVDQKLLNGNKLSTGDMSLAAISLDDAKIVTLDESSSAEFTQEGRKLALNLTEGNIFFNVKEHLADDESFRISTSTMVVGIRGTSGYISASDSGVETLIITDGKVTVTGINPLNGEREDIDVNAGEKLTVTVVTEGDEVTLLMEKEEIMGGDLPEFVKSLLYEDGSLLVRVFTDTGWDNLDDTSSDDETGDANDDENKVADADPANDEGLGDFENDDIPTVISDYFVMNDALGIKNYILYKEGSSFYIKPGFLNAIDKYKVFDIARYTQDLSEQSVRGGVYLLRGDDIRTPQTGDIFFYIHEYDNQGDGKPDSFNFCVMTYNDVTDIEYNESELKNDNLHIEITGHRNESGKQVICSGYYENDMYDLEFFGDGYDISYDPVEDTLMMGWPYEFGISWGFDCRNIGS